jgi:hypothetical protein
MRGQKSNLTFYSSKIKDTTSYKTTNISDLLIKNKNEEKKEKMTKLYSTIMFTATFFVLTFLILK